MSVPDLANQVRFRKEHVAFMTDIKSIFYQVFGTSRPKKFSTLSVGGRNKSFKKRCWLIDVHTYICLLLHHQVSQILEWRK